jgi:hypothetical protein
MKDYLFSISFLEFEAHPLFEEKTASITYEIKHNTHTIENYLVRGHDRNHHAA